MLESSKKSFMRRMSVLISICLCTVLYACTSSNQEEEVNCNRILDFKVNNEITTSSFVKQIEYIPLEMNESALFREINKIVIKNELIYIGDFHKHGIYVYDMKGKHRFSVDERGQGPGEYIEIKSFAVDDRYIYTIDNFKSRINLYDCTTGKFVRSKELPIVAWDIETLHNGDFIFAFIPLKGGVLKHKQPNFRIFITDENFKVKTSLFEFDKDYYDPIGQRTYFTTTDEYVVFGSYFFDGFTLFNRNNLENYEFVGVKFENKASQKDRESMEEMRKHQYISGTPYICKRHISIQIAENKYIKSYLYNDSISAFTANSKDNAYSFLIAPIGNYRDKYIAQISSFEQYNSLTENGFPKADSAIENSLKEGGYVLVVYTMK